MLQASRREHNVTELYLRRNTARNAGVQDAIRMKALNQDARRNGCIYLAYAGADQRNLFPLDFSRQKAHTRAYFFFCLGEPRRKAAHLFFHRPNDTNRHNASFAALR